VESFLLTNLDFRYYVKVCRHFPSILYNIIIYNNIIYNTQALKQRKRKKENTASIIFSRDTLHSKQSTSSLCTAFI